MVLTEPMTPEPAVFGTDDTTAWHTDDLPVIDVKLRSCIYNSDWLADAPSPFDVHHNETGRLYATNSGISPTILGEFDPKMPSHSIPMGYTNLYLLEKRAVIAEGRLIRLWPQRYKPDHTHLEDGCRAITEGDSSKHLSLGLSSSINHAVHQAKTLSSRMNGAPVIVTKTLTDQFWH
jgi:hypothetical protein